MFTFLFSCEVIPHGSGRENISSGVHLARIWLIRARTSHYARRNSFALGTLTAFRNFHTFYFTSDLVPSSVRDPDPDPHVFGFLDPDPDPLVRGTDPAKDPDPSLLS